MDNPNVPNETPTSGDDQLPLEGMEAYIIKAEATGEETKDDLLKDRAVHLYRRTLAAKLAPDVYGSLANRLNFITPTWDELPPVLQEAWNGSVLDLLDMLNITPVIEPLVDSPSYNPHTPSNLGSNDPVDSL